MHRTDTEGEGHVRMEAEIVVMCPQAKERQGPSASSKGPRRRETVPPEKCQREHNLGDTLVLDH